MKANERFNQLLENEEFQNEILKLKNSKGEAQKEFLEKYSISEKEYKYAWRLFNSISFRKKELSRRF